ncbi:L domain-like protein [Dioscorea alata]|uniref:L domain-like protein n=1 Tax=Dioscorea alata TaxID=55571 RepID=A0ACB7WN35_DIOAL|nr:L domain-like protein [Dioscorea alata]
MWLSQLRRISMADKLSLKIESGIHSFSVQIRTAIRKASNSATRLDVQQQLAAPANKMVLLLEMRIKPSPLEISLDTCQDLESLPAWLYRLPLLKQLSIKHCPRFHSLPTGGLPSSLTKLNIIECDPGLMERCQQEGYQNG